MCYHCNMQKYTTIRKTGGSIVSAIPPEIVNVFGLIPGDSIHWEIDGGKITIEFYKAVRNDTPALREGEAVVAGDAAE
jgi:antitoxin component of MazEF toxin-antitoxin module